MMMAVLQDTMSTTASQSGSPLSSGADAVLGASEIHHSAEPLALSHHMFLAMKPSTCTSLSTLNIGM